MVDETARTIRERVAADEQARQRRYRRAWEAYYGQHPQPLRVKKNKPNDNIIVNYCRLIVDVGIAFLFGEPDEKGLKELRFATDADDGATSVEEAWLQMVWRANRKMTTLQKIGLNGAVCGNTFVKVQRPPVPGGPPRIIVLDPAIVTPTWNPDDIDDVDGWQILYDATDPATGKPVQRRQTIERDGRGWTITDAQRVPPAETWQELSVERWPWAWSPIHHCQNLPDPNVFWGLADLEKDVLDLNAAVNFVLSNINTIVRYHAHPKTWGRGFRSDQMKVGADESIILESADAELRNLEMLSDLSSSTAFWEALRKALRETSHVPEVALGGFEDASRVSSLALKVLYGPLLMHTGRKRATYGEMLQELNAHLLEMGGMTYDGPVVNRWPFVLPEDPQQEAQTLLIDQQLGASKDTTLRRRGYNPAREAELRAEEGDGLGAQLLRAFERGDENV